MLVYCTSFLLMRRSTHILFVRNDIIFWTSNLLCHKQSWLIEFEAEESVVRGFETVLAYRLKSAAMQLVRMGEYFDHFAGGFPLAEAGGNRVYLPVSIKCHQVDLIGKEKIIF